MWYTIVTVIHVLACFFLATVVLLQQGKGSDVNAVFGGSSQTLFGSSGAGNLLTKLTSASAVIFMLTSLTLTYGAAKQSSRSLFDSEPVSVPAPTAVPETAPAAATATTSEAPTTDPAPAAATAPQTAPAPTEATATTTPTTTGTASQPSTAAPPPATPPAVSAPQQAPAATPPAKVVQ